MQKEIKASLVIVAALQSTTALAATAEQSTFGKLDDGRTVEAVTLDNGKGMRARVINLGAVLQSLEVPDRQGKSANVVLGYGDAQTYVTNPNYFGASIGRYANRISEGRFVLDGKSYQLPLYGGRNSSHGGKQGFGKQLWRVVSVNSGAEASVTLAYSSLDGEEGFPGAVEVTATYRLGDDNALHIDYQATTTKPTIINLTNHSYFNLGGEASGRSTLDHLLTVPAETITPVDETQIPTGEFMPVAGTPFDFRQPTALGARIRDGRNEQIRLGRGYDINYVVTKAPTPEPHLMAQVEDTISGRVLELSSNQPGLQVYSANFVNGSVVGASGTAYRQSDGLALEPELFPDTPNKPAFGSARLAPGETYHHSIVYRFSTK